MQQREDAASLRELAERMLGAQSLFGISGEPPRARLFPGVVPPLPFELPLPPRATVVGSVVTPATRRAYGGATTETAQVLLDLPYTTIDVLAFYDAELGGAGWTIPAPPAFPPQHGFQTTLPNRPGRAYCRGPKGPSISVTELARPSGGREVRLQITMSNPGLCGEHPRWPGPAFYSNVPRLTAPPGVQMWSRGGGGGGSSWHSEATLDSTMPAADVEAHFAAQLVAAGWQRRSGGAAGPSAWSAWTVPDDESEIRGMLYVLEDPDLPRRWLHLHAESDEQDNPGYFNSQTLHRIG